jgi:hypothetical protein
MNLCSGKKLTKEINQLSFKVFIKSFSTLWISIMQTLIDCLGNNVIEPFEKLFFSLLVRCVIVSDVFDELETNKVSCNTIQKEF